MKYCLLAIALCTYLPSHAQTTRKVLNGQEVTFTYVEQMPKPGYDLNGYILKNIHLLDTTDLPAGKVVVRFAINEDGSISDVVVVTGVDHGIDNAVLKAIKAMPAWIPGRQHGKPARVMYALPVRLHLEN